VHSYYLASHFDLGSFECGVFGVCKARYIITEDSDEDYEDFAGNAFCSYVSIRIDAWILNTSAIDHMSPELKTFINPKPSKQKPYINMADGSMVSITHTGQISLANGLKLQQVLCVPEFKFSLLSVSRLTQDEQCYVVFYPNFCLIHDYATNALRAIGKQQGGMYYLVNEDLSQHQVNIFGKPVHVSTQPCAAASLVDIMSQNKLLHSQCVTQKDDSVVNKDTLWHLILGHAPLSSLEYVVDLDEVKSNEVCLTCHMEK